MLQAILKNELQTVKKNNHSIFIFPVGEKGRHRDGDVYDW